MHEDKDVSWERRNEAFLAIIQEKDDNNLTRIVAKQVVKEGGVWTYFGRPAAFAARFMIRWKEKRKPGW